MECNKDEGLRAKEIADKKFGENDITGAKKFALKAQSLYPGTDGIQQLLATISVHLCIVNKIGGETEWYGVLGVDPVVDDETVRKRYRTLALSLHPDKNKSVGAAAVFSVLKDAWDLLSDKAKRVAYNKRRSSHVYQNSACQNVSTANQASKGANSSVHQKVPTAKSSKARTGSTHQKVPTGAQGPQGANGFAQEKFPTRAQGSCGANGSAHRKVPTGAQGSHKTNGIKKKSREYNAQTQGANCSTRDKFPAGAHGSHGANGSGHQKVPPGAQGSHGFNGTRKKPREYNAQTQMHRKRRAPASAPIIEEPKPGSYWTKCPTCMMQWCYVYCINCHKMLSSAETVPPTSCGSKTTTPFQFENITAEEC